MSARAIGKALRRLLFSLLLLALAFGLALLGHAARDRGFARIEDGLYLGGAVKAPPSGTEAVVNLCGQEDAYTVEASLWDPVFEGGKLPNLDWLRRVVSFIETQRKAGRTTYVHCRAGVNRSAAAVTAYLMRKHGWGRDEALAFVQARRPQAQPNPALMRLLADWERALQDERDREGGRAKPGEIDLAVSAARPLLAS